MNPALRKAAILVTALDPTAADQLLDQMGEQQAARVRNAAMELDEVDSAEQDAILVEFFGGSSQDQLSDDGVELALSSSRSDLPHGAREGDAQRFHFLHDAPSGELARRLHEEHPQLIALVAAHLPPEKSAEVLEHLPPLLRTEVLDRLTELDDADPAILADLERELERIIGGVRRRSVSGQRHDQVQAILGHLRRRADRPRIASRHPEAVKPLRVQGPARQSEPANPVPMISFEQLLSLAAADFFAVFDEADPRVVMLALAGAPRRLFERYLAQFSTERALEFERHLEQLRPLRLRDVEAAQQELATLAGRRLQAAKTAAESSRRFAAAA